jgi:hypothetical protein
MSKRIVSIAEASKILGVSRSAIYTFADGKGQNIDGLWHKHPEKPECLGVDVGALAPLMKRKRHALVIAEYGVTADGTSAIITAKQASELLGISLHAVSRAAARGEIKAVPFELRRRIAIRLYYRDSVIAWRDHRNQRRKNK